MSDEYAREEDVIAVLGGQRVSYPNLIAGLQAQGLPTRGVGMVVKSARFTLSDPDGRPWLDQYGVEPDEPGFQDGPMMVEVFGGDRDE